ncbi:MAG TPA: DUF4159 domain-containing protein [Vicinamibacterales bacterium]|jgi:hypothetical protein|nr:DUF4159 domain-containing protein [Vicinamibacterales bacterium]
MSGVLGRARRWRAVATIAILLIALASIASAQFGRGGGRRGGGGRGGGGGQFFGGRLPEGRAVPPRYPPKNFEDGAFTVCKIEYTQVRFEDMGVGWSTDYPYAGINLMTRLTELTKTPISRDPDGNPNYWVVRLTDPELFRCPFTMASDVGTIGLSDQEAERLRAYLLKGGFLWVDDFWGTPAWNQWSAEIHRALPEYPIIDVPPDHPVRKMMFQIDEVVQVTNIQNWRRTGNTQERGSDSPHADFRIISNERGRIMVVMTHNTDIADSWEREGEDHDFFEAFSPRGYQLGMNVLLYSLTH